MGAKDYIQKILKNYEMTYGEKPKERFQPLDSDDHPEVDTSELLSEEGITQYQSLIGELQWAVALGRFEIFAALISLSRFRVSPRIGHLERLRRIYGYLRKYPDGAIRFQTGIPDYDIPISANADWTRTVYGEVSEELPKDMPVPKGKPVRTSTFMDANLYHCLVTGRAATGILHFLNQTPIEWFAKKQGSVETATYGSEFVAARQATEQIIDLRYSLRMIGIPIDGRSWMFGDNKSVIDSSTIPHSRLGKRHNALSYHRVREAIASGVIYFVKILGIDNLADVLTKYAAQLKFWPLVEPILFWKGDPLSKGIPNQGEGSRIRW
jgi:hypothetical protein